MSSDFPGADGIKHRNKSKSHLGGQQTGSVPTVHVNEAPGAIKSTQRRNAHRYSNSQGTVRDWLAIGINPNPQLGSSAGAVDRENKTPKKSKRASSEVPQTLENPREVHASGSNESLASGGSSGSRSKTSSSSKRSKPMRSSSDIHSGRSQHGSNITVSSPTHLMPQSHLHMIESEDWSSEEVHEPRDNMSEGSIIFHLEDQNALETASNGTPRSTGPYEDNITYERSKVSSSSSHAPTQYPIVHPGQDHSMHHLQHSVPIPTSNSPPVSVPKLSLGSVKLGVSNEQVKHTKFGSHGPLHHGSLQDDLLKDRSKLKPIGPLMGSGSLGTIGNHQPTANPAFVPSKYGVRPYRQVIGDQWSIPIAYEPVYALVSATIEDMYLGTSTLLSNKFSHRHKPIITPLLKDWPDGIMPGGNAIPGGANPDEDDGLDEYSDDDDLESPTHHSSPRNPNLVALSPMAGTNEEDKKSSAATGPKFLSSLVNRIKRFTPHLSPNPNSTISSPPQINSPTPSSLSGSGAHMFKRVFAWPRGDRKLKQSTEAISPTDESSSDSDSDEPPTSVSPPGSIGTVAHRPHMTRTDGRKQVTSMIAADGEAIRGPYFRRLRAASQTMDRAADNIGYVQKDTIEELQSFTERLETLYIGHEKLENRGKKLGRQIEDSKHASHSAQSLLLDNIYKASHAIEHIKFTNRTKPHMKALVVFLSVLVLFAGTFVWLIAAAYRALLRSIRYCKNILYSDTTTTTSSVKTTSHTTGQQNQFLTNQGILDASSKMRSTNTVSSDYIPNSPRNATAPDGMESSKIEKLKYPDESVQKATSSILRTNTADPLSPTKTSVMPATTGISPVQIGSQQLQSLTDMSKSIKALRMQELVHKKKGNGAQQ